MQTGDLNAHLHPQRGVEVGQRLIKQEYLRLRHQRAANRHPLTLPPDSAFGRRSSRCASCSTSDTWFTRWPICALLAPDSFRPNDMLSATDRWGYSA